MQRLYLCKIIIYSFVFILEHPEVRGRGPKRLDLLQPWHCVRFERSVQPFKTPSFPYSFPTFERQSHLEMGWRGFPGKIRQHPNREMVPTAGYIKLEMVLHNSILVDNLLT